MSAARFAAIALVSLLAGAAVGMAITRTAADPVPATPAASPAPAAEPMPIEAPTRGIKQARLDDRCGRSTWPYIPAECLKRIAAPKAPSVTIARHDPENRTTVLIKTPTLRTANR
ncbi:hypothetical protein [Prosthecodimorpha staleyi]|uniref:Uncharacterized protein n=1 Tax=Prosthecodimorpha staleyi TaxID=2840188 RepID=A0A947D844_9HYPH|nr:hypothetical protein [Prosthecodimorpha staleyi]MBT9288584.1 hypothetical protein [Prosthecodimorpha staleyi]